MKLALLLPCAALLACAAPQPPTPPAAPKPYVRTAKAPVCNTKLQCDQMWLVAQEVIQNTSRMRLRLVTDTRLETFAATAHGRLTGTVLKFPLSADSYEIRASLRCYGATPCPDMEANGVDLFNLLVGGPDAMLKK
jgi:hypothetical protein